MDLHPCLEQPRRVAHDFTSGPNPYFETQICPPQRHGSGHGRPLRSGHKHRRWKKVMSSDVGNLRGLPGADALPGRLLRGLGKEHRSTAVPNETEIPERVGQFETAAVSTAGLQGRAITYREFVAAVQRAGAMDSAGEAEAAADAALDELAGCLSWQQAQNLAAWLPKPLRQRVSRRSFGTSMSRFAPQAFLHGMAEQEGVGQEKAAGHARAVFSTLDRTLPDFLTRLLHSELASLWAPLTRSPAATQHRL
jgi:uncharacterized protein (DUF2267 family)